MLQTLLPQTTVSEVPCTLYFSSSPLYLTHYSMLCSVSVPLRNHMCRFRVPYACCRVYSLLLFSCAALALKSAQPQMVLFRIGSALPARCHAGPHAKQGRDLDCAIQASLSTVHMNTSLKTCKSISIQQLETYSEADFGGSLYSVPDPGLRLCRHRAIHLHHGATAACGV